MLAQNFMGSIYYMLVISYILDQFFKFIILWLSLFVLDSFGHHPKTSAANNFKASNGIRC